MRASWDETWMAVADAVALRSVCQKRQIGCAIVDSSQRIVATGYNGEPAEWRGNCATGACPRGVRERSNAIYDDCIAIHSEANALLFCDRRDRLDGALYVTSTVCFDCAKLVANSGLERVVMKVDRVADAHRDPTRSIKFMRFAGLKVDTWEI